MKISPISFKSYTPQNTSAKEDSAEHKNQVSTAKVAAGALAGAAVVTLAVLAAKGKLKFKNKPKEGTAPKPKKDVKPPEKKIKTDAPEKQNKLSDTIKELFGKECKVSELSKEEQEKLAKTLIEREPDPDMKQELRRIFDQGLWDIL